MCVHFFPFSPITVVGVRNFSKRVSRLMIPHARRYTRVRRRDLGERSSGASFHALSIGRSIAMMYRCVSRQSDAPNRRPACIALLSRSLISNPRDAIKNSPSAGNSVGTTPPPPPPRVTHKPEHTAARDTSITRIINAYVCEAARHAMPRNRRALNQRAGALSTTAVASG